MNQANDVFWKAYMKTLPGNLTLTPIYSSLLRWPLVLLLLVLMTTTSGAESYCFDEAGAQHNVPPGLLWAIAKVESDFDPNLVNNNSNGTIDVGVMQINSCWKESLGAEVWESLGDPCVNIKVGAGILADCLSRYGYSWEGIGCYNAITPEKRATYARKVIHILEWMQTQQQQTAAN